LIAQDLARVPQDLVLVGEYLPELSLIPQDVPLVPEDRLLVAECRLRH
jgi:hypothetical protein